jgi:imidazolonepropionase-like amidohydrolase
MMKERGMALVPTLKLWPSELKRVGLSPEVIERVLGIGVAQTRAFAELGGQLLFGTDVGYLTDYDPTDDFVYLQRAGLTTMQILAMLTTAPADRFGRSGTGRLGPGLAADLVVLDGDPAQDVRVFAKVRLTMRDGRTIHVRPP